VSVKDFVTVADACAVKVPVDDSVIDLETVWECVFDCRVRVSVLDIDLLLVAEGDCDIETSVDADRVCERVTLRLGESVREVVEDLDSDCVCVIALEGEEDKASVVLDERVVV
jgi:hypothetical protein